MGENKKKALEDKGYTISTAEEFLAEQAEDVKSKLEKAGKFDDPEFERDMIKSVTERIREICDVCTICNRIFLKPDLTDLNTDRHICKECEDEL